MSSRSQLKVRAEELIELERVAPCGAKRVMLIDPEAVLALIAENEALRKSLVEVRECVQREYWDEYAGLDETRAVLDEALAKGGAQ